MAYIYQIVNDINNKVYIGKTELTIEKRFQQHCFDAFRAITSTRPLYRAMQKYGIEHFHIELIEETNEPEIREQFWIENKDSYHNGYNATLGGDGKKYIDYTQVVDLWNQGLSVSEISRKLNHDSSWIAFILKQSDINPEALVQRGNLAQAKSVLQLNTSGEIINQFTSFRQAAQSMLDQKLTRCKIGTGASHISEVCRNKRKTFAGFIWKMAE